MKTISWDGWFRLEVPAEWTVDETDETINVFDPNGHGALTISTYSKSSDAQKTSAELALSFAAQQGVSEKDVAISPFAGDASIANYRSEANAEITYWEIAVFFRSSQTVLLSFNSTERNSTQEQKVLKKIWKSFRWEVLL